MKAMKEGAKAALRQRERTELTCQKILSSARDIFARDGFQAAKLQEIAAKAGYTRGAFYANFQSKEELFVAVAGQQMRELVSTVLQAVRSKSGLEPKCKELLRAIKESSEVRTWALLLIEFNLFLLRQPKRKKQIAALHEQQLKGIGEVFEELYEAAECEAPMPLSIVGLGFISLLQGLVLQEMLNGTLITPQVTSDLLSRYVHALVAEV